MRAIISLCSAIGLIATTAAPSPPWSPDPWLADLSQMQQAFRTKYANIDWLEHDRELDLDALFKRAAAVIRSSHSDAEAMRVFDRVVERIGDGHVAIDWPRPKSSLPNAVSSPSIGTSRPHDVCRDMGYDAHSSSAGIGPHLRGYRPVRDSTPFPAGIVTVGAQKIGVIRIGVFDPKGNPVLCQGALQALHIAADRACDDQCQDSVMTWTYDRFTAALEEQVDTLKAHGATALLVDLTGNGGGSEWTEAAARILTPKLLTSERLGFVRGPHWAGQWKSLAEKLRQAALTTDSADRPRLRAWAAEADEARRDAEQPCAVSGTCPLVGRAGYATGLVGAVKSGDLAGKPWGELVFSIAQFPYHDGVWSGPLAVLVDNETWSAAEEFAALLQDNHAAVIVGTRTGGAGCGHTWGGTPTVLKNSGATLEVPDCVRFRADGSNEVGGVIPDILVGMRHNDGAAFKARLIEKHLPDAFTLAATMASDRRSHAGVPIGR